MIKKNKILITIILIVLGANVYFFIYLGNKVSFLNSEIQRVSQKLTNLQSEHSNYIKGTGEVLKSLEESINLIQAATQEQESTLSESLVSLKDDLARVNADFSGKYNALNRAPPVRTEPRAVVTSEISRTQQPTPEPESPFLLEDVRLNGFFTSGKEALQGGRFTQAKRAFKELLNLTPPVWEAHLYYIEAAYYENPGKAARDKEVKGLLESLPVELNAKGKVSKLAGLMALETGEYTRGLSLIKESLDHSPGDRALLLRLGTAAFAYKDYETCVSSLVKAGPQEPEDIYTLGRAYQELEQWDAALYQFNFCLVADESYFRAYKNIGQIKKQSGAYGEAVSVFTQYHSHRKEGETLLSLGECFLALDNQVKAVKAFQEILSRYPESPEAGKAKTLLEKMRESE